MTDWREMTLRLTVVLVAASAFLLGAGVVGLAATLPLAGVFLLAAALLGVVRDPLGTLPRVVGYDLGIYGRDLWAAPGLAVLVTLAFLGASPGELTALGGVVGLVGMVNYFLRPLYGLGVWFLQRVARVTS